MPSDITAWPTPASLPETAVELQPEPEAEPTTQPNGEAQPGPESPSEAVAELGIEPEPA